MKGPALFLALLLGAASARARMQQDVSLEPYAQAKISVGSCFDTLALGGYAPVDVTINNHSGETRTWIFGFVSPGGYANGNSVESTFTVTVENNGTRTVPLLVPTGSVANNYEMPLSMQVKGYGVEVSGQEMIGGRSWSGKDQTRFVVISESLGTSIWSSLTKQLDSEGKDLLGSTVNPGDLPEDWRGLSGVAALWMTGDELDHLDAAQRQAIQTWVRAGGLLMLCGAQAVPQDFRFAGFGEVRTLPAALNLGETVKTIKRLPKYNGEFNALASRSRLSLAFVKPNVVLLGTFMGLFAIVIGPLNLFGFALRRRERLLWTTPLISLCATAVLIGMIAIKDGAGGHGLRNAVVCLFPQSHNAVVMQEQISRTGLLLGSAFQTRDPVSMRQLQISASGPERESRRMRNDGNSYGKDWFVSRASQAQRIVSVTPTRAEITLLNGADAAKGAAPVIVSSFEATLDNLSYTDAQNRTWQGSAIHTGQKQTLQLSKNASSIPLPDLVTDSLRTFSNAPGSFVATANQSGDYVATLGSIRWTDEPVTYIGPVTGQP